jgi:hypothetical protein
MEGGKAMSPLRRVFAERAGPSALGILVPPGRRTVVILRPRALAWDLLLARPSEQSATGAAFGEMDREGAAAAADAVCRALEDWAGGGAGSVELLPARQGGHHVWAALGAFAFVACPRQPGQPYRPAAFADGDDARAAATAIAAVLCPPAGAQQEVYFNTHKFSH